MVLNSHISSPSSLYKLPRELDCNELTHRQMAVGRRGGRSV